MDNISGDDMQKGKIEVNICDSGSFTRNQVIGLYDFDLLAIYNSQNHEIWKQWIGLFDRNELKKTVKGYLKLSVTILRENDEKYDHENDEENNDDDDGGVLNVLLPPFISHTYKQLIIYIFATKYLPNLFSNNDLQYYMEISLSSKELETEVNKISLNQYIQNSQTINWNTKVLLPIKEPSFESNVYIDVFQNETLICKIEIKYNKLYETNKTDRIKWINMYGGHYDKILYAKPKKSIVTKMNKGLIEATCFRGQIALSCDIDELKC